MDAVHIQTDGMYCAACPPRIETEIEHIPGVKAARAYRSMRLTSVLFDPNVVLVDTILDKISSAGFSGHVLNGGHVR